MSPLQVQLDRLRRRRWLVLVITVIATGLGVGSSLVAEPTYIGTSSLTVVSLEHAPEQDAVLALGYAEYFNDESTQQVLIEKADPPADVSFGARTAANGAILYVDASSPDPEHAAAAAKLMATVFRDEVRAQARVEADRAIAELRGQIELEIARLYSLAEAEGAERSLANEQLSALQAQISEIRAARSPLQQLQLEAGVTSSAPSPVQNGALALLGGLVLGCATAIAVAVVENRITTPEDVRRRLGVDTLAVIGTGRGRSRRRARRRDIQVLTNVVRLADMRRPTTLAVTAPRETSATAEVAEGISYFHVLQNESTLLMKTDSRQTSGCETGRQRAGVADYLADRNTLEIDPMIVPVGNRTLLVLPLGEVEDDPYELITPKRFVELVERAERLADFTVIEAPPVLDAAEAQVVCAAADRTILVVDEGVTRVSDAIEAARSLERAHATVVGVVIVRRNRTERGSLLDVEEIATAGADAQVLPPQTSQPRKPRPWPVDDHNFPVCAKSNGAAGQNGGRPTAPQRADDEVRT